MPFRQRFVLGGLSLLLAGAIWMPLLHLLFVPGKEGFRSQAGISPVARQLAKRHLDLWASPAKLQAELHAMQVNNPEWDFMGRTFLVLSLANMAMREPAEADALIPVMDRIIADTQGIVDREGVNHFMMAYGRTGTFLQRPARSIFIDGEIAMMMGARRMIREDEGHRERMNELVMVMAERMAASPRMCCESYPNECWMFCNTLALAAIKIHDVLDQDDHSALFTKWVATARKDLTDPTTGILWSSFMYDGDSLDGPEGSSIWTAAHCLQIVDPAFAADQYDRGRRELARRCLGFAWAAEWPPSWKGPMDVDSGPTIPIIEVNAGSSGQAFIAAAGFEDTAYYQGLATTLRFAAFPMIRDGGLRFCASNQVGDAVLLYSTVSGPLWEEVLKRDRARKGS